MNTVQLSPDQFEQMLDVAKLTCTGIYLETGLLAALFVALAFYLWRR